MQLKKGLILGYILVICQIFGCSPDALATSMVLNKSASALSQSLVQMAMKKNEQGNYIAALNDLNEAIRLDQKDIDAYFNRGLIYYHLHSTEKAIEDFSIAINLNNNFVEAYVNRGNIYLELEDYSMAMRDYNQVLNSNPNNSLALNNLGLVYLNLGEYQKADKYFKKSIIVQPNYPDAYFNQGLLLLELNQKKNALVSFQKAMHLSKTQHNLEVYQAAREELAKLNKHP